MVNLELNTLKKLQAVLLEILEVFDDFCKRNSIEYFLDSGTALGAKRHSGFIPWDDDIDIGMFRSDYDKFLSLIDEYPFGYSVHTFSNTPGYAGMFTKIYKNGTVFATKETIDAKCPQGIFIDIFPYDELSSDKREKNRQIRNAAKWQRVSYLYHSWHISSIDKGLKAPFLKIFSFIAHTILRRIVDREKIKTNFEKARTFQGLPSGEYITLAYPYNKALRKEDILPAKNMVFCEKEYPCPRNIEKYLVAFYGDDWEKLPPEEDRHTHAPVEIVF